MEENISYEQASNRLAEIIVILEENNVSLNEANLLFDEGKKLIEICYKSLDGAKGKLTEIRETLNKLTEE